MEYHRRPSKDIDRTTRESDHLFTLYESIVEHWRTNQWSAFTAKEITDRFAFIYGRRYFDENVPSVHIEYLSNFGAARINFWAVNNSVKSIVVSTDVYTQGPDRKTRGKGRQTFEFFDDYYQSLADQTGYTIYCLETPNLASERLLPDKEGFHNVTDDELNEILIQSDEYTIAKVVGLISQTHENTKLKKYYPSKKNPKSIIPDNVLSHIKDLNFIE